MKLSQENCPHCGCSKLKIHSVYDTKNNGKRNLYKCKECNLCFSMTKNTPLEGLRKELSFIIQVIVARSEGMAFNATCRTFNISPNTLIDWERRLACLKLTLLLYALTQQFLEQIIEGDELYTKVAKNLSPDESFGWTIVLMERASRFIWEMECGKKDRKLFENALKILCEVINETDDLSLLTDGERRYGNILFEICSELIKTGKPGRPKKTLPKGVKVKIKNKGSQSGKKGTKREKYQSPCPEHPDTTQNIDKKDIHANHVEALNASIRRKCSAFRRKTNTYAKATEGLQRVLDIYWLTHNFVKKHFTTKMVPAVALGIIKKGLSWMEIFMIRKVA